MKFPVVELVDRWAIAVVKHQKTNGANQAELDFYSEQMQELDQDLIRVQLDRLIEIHYAIWSLEDDFKKCRDSKFPLEELGRRALEIRDLNNRRVQYKNKIAEAVGSAVLDIKQDHVSSGKS